MVREADDFGDTGHEVDKDGSGDDHGGGHAAGHDDGESCCFLEGVVEAVDSFLSDEGSDECFGGMSESVEGVGDSDKYHESDLGCGECFVVDSGSCIEDSEFPEDDAAATDSEIESESDIVSDGLPIEDFPELGQGDAGLVPDCVCDHGEGDEQSGVVGEGGSERDAFDAHSESVDEHEITDDIGCIDGNELDHGCGNSLQSEEGSEDDHIDGDGRRGEADDIEVCCHSFGDLGAEGKACASGGDDESLREQGEQAEQQGDHDGS